MERKEDTGGETKVLSVELIVGQISYGVEDKSIKKPFQLWVKWLGSKCETQY